MDVLEVARVRFAEILNQMAQDLWRFEMEQETVREFDPAAYDCGRANRLQQVAVVENLRTDCLVLLAGPTEALRAAVLPTTEDPTRTVQEAFELMELSVIIERNRRTRQEAHEQNVVGEVA